MYEYKVWLMCMSVHMFNLANPIRGLLMRVLYYPMKFCTLVVVKTVLYWTAVDEAARGTAKI